MKIRQEQSNAACHQLTVLTGEKKFTYVYEGLRSPLLPPGFCKKKKAYYFSNRVAYIKTEPYFRPISPSKYILINKNSTLMEEACKKDLIVLKQLALNALEVCYPATECPRVYTDRPCDEELKTNAEMHASLFPYYSPLRE